MKQLIFATLCAAISATSVFAQKAPEKEDLKVGNNNLEVSFNPFASDSKTFKLNSGAVRYRRFFGKNAVRVNFGFGANNDTNTDTENTKTIASQHTSFPATPTYNNNIVDDPYTTITKTINNDWNLKLTVGYERHFNLNRRMSMYVGGEIGYAGQRGTTTTEWSKTGYTNRDVWDGNKYYRSSETMLDHSYTKENRNGNGYNAVVMGICTGLDFYVYKNLYVGLELGLEFNHRSFLSNVETSYEENKIETSKSYSSTGVLKKNEQTTNNIVRKDGFKTTTTMEQDFLSGNWDKTVTTEYDEKDYSHKSNSFKIDVNPALRLGWRF